MTIRNPIVRDQIKNPNRSRKIHGDKFKNILQKIKEKEGREYVKTTINSY